MGKDARPGVADVESWLFERPRTNVFVVVATAGALAVGAAATVRPVDGIALVAVIALGIAVVARPVLGAYLLVAIVPVTAGFQKGFPIGNVNLSEALVAFVGGLLLLTVPRHGHLRWYAFDWMLFAFCAGWFVFGAADAVLLHAGLGYSSLDPLIGPFQFLILYRSLAVTLRRPQQRRWALTVLFLSSLPVDLVAFLQQARIEVVNRLVARMTGSDVFGSYAFHYFARATGPFPHWTPLAGYLTVILMSGLACLLSRVQLPISRHGLEVVLVLGAIALVLSAELSAICCSIGGAIVLGIWAGRTRAALRALAITAAVVALVAGPYLDARLNTQFSQSAGSGRSSLVPQTISYRWQIWTQQYLPAIRDRLFTGWGQTLPASITWPYTESQYVTVLMAGGLPLFVLFCYELQALYKFGRRIARSDGDDAILTRSLGSALAVLVLISVPMIAVYPYLTSGGMPAPLFIVAGIAAAAYFGRDAGDRARPAGTRTAEGVRAALT